MIDRLDNIRHNSTNRFGNKAGSLVRLISDKRSVPSGFVISTDIYTRFLEENRLFPEISDKINGINLQDFESLNSSCEEIKEMFTRSSFSSEIEDNIFSQIQNLSTTKYAIRSSSSCEDMPNASFAGQYETYLDVKKDNIISSIKQCYASVYNPGAIMYRKLNTYPEHVQMAVIVQEMIEPDFAGVLFTVYPQKQDCIIIELASGNGEKVVSGTISPNRYVVDRKTLTVVEAQEKEYFNMDYIRPLIDQSIEVEKSFGYPQDIEFAIKDGHIFLLQSRNITTLNK